MTPLTDQEINTEQARAEKALEAFNQQTLDDFRVPPEHNVQNIINKVWRGLPLTNGQATVLTKQIEVLTKVDAANTYFAERKMHLSNQVKLQIYKLLRLVDGDAYTDLENQGYLDSDEAYTGEVQDQNDEIAAIFNDAK